MVDDLIPFALESDAKEFFQGNKGKQIYRFDRMTEKLHKLFRYEIRGLLNHSRLLV